jgi:glycosyltransferase involved in cell wall biosynthesis
MVAHLSKVVDTRAVASLRETAGLTHLIVPQKALVPADTADLARDDGTVRILDVCELFVKEDQRRWFAALLEHADVVTVASHAFARYLEKETKAGSKGVHYVPDAVEVSYRRKDHVEGPELTVFWYGFQPNMRAAAPVLQAVAAIDGVRLVTMSNSDQADHAWEIQRWEELLEEADVGISPVPQERAFFSVVDFKSSHKLTSFMAKGVPVVGSPVSEYEHVIEHGTNGFIARSSADWVEIVNALKDPDVRNRIGARGYDTALEYSGEAVARIWEGVLRGDRG